VAVLRLIECLIVAALKGGAGLEYSTCISCALQIYLSKGSAGKKVHTINMDKRWGVLRLVGGVLDAESSRFADSREEQEEEEARVIAPAIGISTTPVARHRRRLRWIITLQRFPGIPIPWEIRYFYFSSYPPFLPFMSY